MAALNQMAVISPLVDKLFHYKMLEVFSHVSTTMVNLPNPSISKLIL